MGSEVTVDIMTKCKGLSCKNLKSLCFTTTVKCHTYNVADIYLVVAQLQSLLGTEYLCVGSSWFASCFIT